MDLSVKLKDPGQRIAFTVESIEKWLNAGADARLVICDGSGFDFSEIVRRKFPGRLIESLSFENNQQLVEVHGKGYGEGEIIRYAMAHSAFLKSTDWFVKCTGKLWVDNFSECLKEWNGLFLCKAYFSRVFSFRTTKLEYIDTRFYMVSKDFYLKYFADAHLKVGGTYGTSIEDNFREIVLRNNLQQVLFRSPPVVCGVGGGSGSYYKNTKVRRLKEVLRSRIVQSNRSFSALFNRDP